MLYLRFLREHWRFVGFGVFLTLMSSFGQTFYVALYGADIRAAYDLGNAGFGAMFSAASIASALLLPSVGRLLDRVDVRVYTAVTLASLFAGMAVLSLTPDFWIFAVAMFVVRFTGQSLCVHIATTCMARYYTDERGRALGVTGMGLALGEGVLPSITVAMIAGVGWQETWLISAATFAAVAVILVPYLLKGHAERHRTFVERQADEARRSASGRSWTRAEVLRDPGFTAAMALLLSFPYMATAVYFHQGFIADVRGWSLETIAVGFMVLAVLKVATSLVLGGVIDRGGATRLVPVISAPFAVSLLAILLSSHPLVPLVYLGLFGVTIGMLQPVTSAFLAERYGVANLGGIRSMATAVTVMGAAVAPFTTGWLLDASVSVSALMVGFLAYLAVTTAVARIVLVRSTARGLPR
ncbi:MAG: MFS transporter [Alphaproteobacteria bacterium]|nr:MFS transporter [Alphaproteobacteria bacterium]